MIKIIKNNLFYLKTQKNPPKSKEPKQSEIAFKVDHSVLDESLSSIGADKVETLVNANQLHKMIENLVTSSQAHFVFDGFVTDHVELAQGNRVQNDK